MIDPVLCFTCGKVIGNKFNYYNKHVIDKKKKLNMNIDQPSVINISINNNKKQPEGEVLDELGCIRPCCRKMFLTHISLINDI